MRDSFRLYQDKLEGEYKETFKQIDLYFSTQSVDEDTQEEYMGELLDIFLLAQEEGRPVEKITGKNIERFFESFCSTLTGKEKVLKLQDDLKGFAWFTILIPFIELFFAREKIVSEELDVLEIVLESNVFGYILGFGISIVASNIADYITKQFMFRMKKVSMRVWKTIVVIVSVATFFVFFLLLFGQREINLPAKIVYGVSGCYLVLYYLFNMQRIRSRKANRISFWGLVKEEVEKDQDIEVQKQMKKIWEKKNERLRKRGKKELTWQEYLDFLEEDVQKAYRWKPLYDWMPVIVTIPCGLIIFLTDGFDMDFVGFVIILFLVELVLVKGLWKIVQKGLNVKSAWIESARKKLEQE